MPKPGAWLPKHPVQQADEVFTDIEKKLDRHEETKKKRTPTRRPHLTQRPFVNPALQNLKKELST